LAFRSLFSLFSSDLAIDLGTATPASTRAARHVVNEPSIVAITRSTARSKPSQGRKEMLGRTPGNIVAIKPMKDGVHRGLRSHREDADVLIKQATTARWWVRPRIVIACRRRSRRSRNARQDSAYRAKASEVYLIEEAMAARSEPGCRSPSPRQHDRRHRRRQRRHRGHLAGGHRLLEGRARRGNEMDEAIIQYIKRNHNLLIGERTAEQIKMEIGRRFPSTSGSAWESRAATSSRACPRRSRSPTRRFATRWRNRERDRRRRSGSP